MQCGPELLLRAVLVEQRASDPVVSEALVDEADDLDEILDLPIPYDVGGEHTFAEHLTEQGSHA